jgi:hypothetical protein
LGITDGILPVQDVLHRMQAHGPANFVNIRILISGYLQRAKPDGAVWGKTNLPSDVFCPDSEGQTHAAAFNPECFLSHMLFLQAETTMLHFVASVAEVIGTSVDTSTENDVQDRYSAETLGSIQSGKEKKPDVSREKWTDSTSDFFTRRSSARNRNRAGLPFLRRQNNLDPASLGGAQHFLSHQQV